MLKKRGTFESRVDTIAADAARLLGQSTNRSSGIRVGVDVVSISEFAMLIETRGGAAFVKSRFSSAEQGYCEGRADRLAARWAAKEAVAKAIGTGFRGLRPSQIEIVHLPWGQPAVSRAGDTGWPNDAHEWEWCLSLAHEGDAAVAIALGLAATGLMKTQQENELEITRKTWRGGHT